MDNPWAHSDSAQDAGVSTETGTAWSVRWRNLEFRISDEPFVIGRSSRCDLRVNDALVSRRHASLTATTDGLFVEDLNSSNGVFVNGERVRRPQRLQHEDRILVGAEEFVVVGRVELSWRDDDGPPEEPTQGGSDEEPSGSRQPPKRDSTANATTRKADALTYLSTIADRLLQKGQVSVAARMLSEHLKEVLEGVRMGEEVPAEVFASATDCALKLADASWDPRWLDYVVELHLAAHRPLSDEVRHRFLALWGRIPSIDLGLLRLYQQHLRERLAFAGAETLLFEAVLAMRSPAPEHG